MCSVTPGIQVDRDIYSAAHSDRASVLLMTRTGRYRWRTRIRRHLPWFLLKCGFAAKGRRDCGAHDWYNQGHGTARCYHCEVGEQPWPSGGQIVDRRLVTGGGSRRDTSRGLRDMSGQIRSCSSGAW
jgi:hypothetical protein